MKTAIVKYLSLYRAACFGSDGAYLSKLNVTSVTTALFT